MHRFAIPLAVSATVLTLSASCGSSKTNSAPGGDAGSDDGPSSEGSFDAGMDTGGGSVFTTLASGQNSPYRIAVDAKRVYWTNQVGGTVMSAPIDGGTPTTLVSGLDGELFGIAVDST